MNPMLALATTRRILNQLRHDPRTIAMVLALPSVLVILLRYVFDSQAMFNRIAPALLAIFPFIVMFIVTSVATLRERTTGTLERLMTLPIGRLDLLAGYACAFGIFAVIQVGIVATIALTWLGMDVPGSLALLVLIAVVDALLGMALGLFASAFARTEFQAVQLMPLLVAPQVLVCGLFHPRGDMTAVLRWLSDVMPLSYAVEGINRATASGSLTGELVKDIGIIVGCALLALLLGAATLRRKTA